MSTKSVSDILNGGGSKAAGWDVKLTTHKGKILKVDVVQARDIKDGTPATWPDGSPKEQLVVTIQTEEHDDVEDDGVRAIYLKGGKFSKTVEGGKVAKTSLEATKDALKAAGVAEFEIGAEYAVQYVTDGDKTNPGFNAPKLFLAEYASPAPAVNSGGLL